MRRDPRPQGAQAVTRRFGDPIHQQIYDALRAAKPLNVEEMRGQGAEGNAYAVGFTLPDQPSHLWRRGTRTYAAWAAGVDNARDCVKAPKVEGS